MLINEFGEIQQSLLPAALLTLELPVLLHTSAPHTPHSSGSVMGKKPSLKLQLGKHLLARFPEHSLQKGLSPAAVLCWDPMTICHGPGPAPELSRELSEGTGPNNPAKGLDAGTGHSRREAE